MWASLDLAWVLEYAVHPYPHEVGVRRGGDPPPPLSEGGGGGGAESCSVAWGIIVESYYC